MDEHRPPPDWPSGSGEMAGRVRSHDWAETALGPAQAWPAGLRVTVQTLLDSAFPAVVLWGPDLVQVYNDGYRTIMAGKHPTGLGQPTAECWPEVWHINEPICARVRAGETVTLEDALFPITRHGPLEEAWFTLCYSPVRETADAVAGVLVTVFETTAGHLAARRRDEVERTLREREARQAFLLGLSDALRPLANPVAVQGEACRLLAGHLGVDRAYYVEVDEAEGTARVERDFVRGAAASLAGTHRVADFAWSVAILRRGRCHVITDTQTSDLVPPAERPACAALGIVACMGVPLIKEGRLVGALCVTAPRARTWAGAEVDLLRDVGERLWAAVERARAEAGLRASRKRQRALIEGMPQLVWRAVADGQWTWSSPQWTRYTGLADQESRGMGWLRALHPDDHEPARAAWALAERTGRLELEHRLYHAAERRHRWFQTRATPLRDEAGHVVEWLGTSTDVDELRRLHEQQGVLLAELQHRVRNTLGVVRSLVRRTKATSADMDDYAANLESRISAFARVQSMVTRSADAGVGLDELVAEELLAHGASEGDGERGGDGPVRLDGPALRLHARPAELLGLAMHELATNAVKHGALASPGGRIDIAWRIEPGRIADGTPGPGPAQLPAQEPAQELALVLVWQESGVGVAAPAPRRRGFGSEMLERTLGFELGATTTLAFRPGGIACTITVPLGDRPILQEAPGVMPDAGSDFGGPAGGRREEAR